VKETMRRKDILLHILLHLPLLPSTTYYREEGEGNNEEEGHEVERRRKLEHARL